MKYEILIENLCKRDNLIDQDSMQKIQYQKNRKVMIISNINSKNYFK